MRIQGVVAGAREGTAEARICTAVAAVGEAGAVRVVVDVRVAGSMVRGGLQVGAMAGRK